VTRRAGQGAVTPLRSALTGRGKVVAVGSVVVAAAGVMLRYPELIGLGAAGAAAVLAALAMVARSPSVQVERTISPARVPRGTQANAQVLVRNVGRRGAGAAAARDLAGPASVPFQIPRLRPGQVHVGQTGLPTSRRGVVASGPLLVDRDDALGLAHRTLDTGEAADLYVRPHPVPLPEIGASLARSVDGPQADTTMEGTLAFHALREYVPGDELRHVHWRASAHAQKLVVKQHVDTAHAALAVVLDVTLPPVGAAGPDSLAEAFEVAVDCAASAAVIAAAQRHPLLLLDGHGQSLLPGTARRHGTHAVDDVLDALTRVEPDGGDAPAARPWRRPGLPAPAAAPAGDPLPGVLRRLAGSGRGNLAIVISTRPMNWLAAPLQQVAGSYARVIAVHAIAAEAPSSGAARTGRVLWVTVRRAEDLAAGVARARAVA
jgi:uncharacterized protein (DUF58 family)